MKLFTRLKAIFASTRVPVDPESEDDAGMRCGVALGEPPHIAHTLSVDQLQGILRSAESGDTGSLFALYRDIRLGHAHTQACLNQRQLNVLNKTLNIVPSDPRSEDDVQAAAACRVLVEHPRWQVGALAHLIKGHFYPLAVLEQTFVPAMSGRHDGLRWLPGDWRAMPYHLLDFTDGRLRLWDADPLTGSRLGSRREIGEDADGRMSEMRHIVHRGHLLTDVPDNWGGPMRAVLFWWLFAVMDRDWWVRFLDRFGAPFIVGKVDSSDDKGKRLLTSAFAAATKLFGLVVSKETDIAVHSVTTTSHGEAFEKLQVFANGELSKLILGQTMTISAQAGGLGGAQAEVQQNTLGDIEAWDLTVLAATVNTSIIAPFLRINGVRGRAVLQVATDTAHELEGRTNFIKAATEAGLELTDEAIEVVSKASGLQLRRRAAPAVFSLDSLTADDRPSAESILRRHGKPALADLDGLALLAAPGFARAFSARHRKLPELVAASSSVADLQTKLAGYFSALRPGEAEEVLEQLFFSAAATGAGAVRRVD